MALPKLVLNLLTGILLGSSAVAGPVVTEVLETMMGAQANEALFIGQTFGVDNAATLHFSSDLDPLARTFSYATLVNQSYLGQTLALSTTGHYDTTLLKYDWTSTGSLGNQAWNSVGSVEWVGDPTGTVSTDVTIGNVTVNVRGTVTWDQGPVNATSTGTYTFASSGGTQWGPFNGRDRFDIPTGEWVHTVEVGKGRFTPDGILTFAAGFLAQGGGGGAGRFDLAIRGVPEPSALGLVLLALAAAAASRAGRAACGRPARSVA